MFGLLSRKGEPMEISWIARNSQGIVRAFCDVAYADRETLEEFAQFGRTVDLVQAERILLNKPLPPDAVILKSGIHR